MHNVALNYEPSGISASTKLNGTNSNLLEKSSPSSVTSGSVTRVTNLSTLVGTSAIPVDYLIITHSSLFNSSALTTLANRRNNYNGYDVVIVKVDDIYNDTRFPSTITWVDIRDFIKDVYLNGKANHTGDGHLAYICLVGDALQDDNSNVMVPAEYYYTGFEAAGDYYYACTGGDSDPTLDLMYGRLSVGNETELSSVVNKIISYENNSNGNWNNKYMFVSSAPEFFSTADPKMKEMTEIVPPTYQKSYAYRAYSGNTTVVTEYSTLFGQTFTSAQYSDPNNLCGSDLLNSWLYDQLNSSIGIHTFVFEDHGGWNALSPNEGCGRRIFYLNGTNCIDPGNINSVNTRLSNNLYSFMIFNCCDAGHLDHTSGDCVSEVVLNFANRGAIGVLSSTRDSDVGSFGVIDKKVLQAMYSSLSHIMGEAVFESKLNMATQYKRQYNLYGDPATNLWPTGYTISENLTISGNNTISENITVASGVTLTISAGANLKFNNGASLIVNGALNAIGTSLNKITFDRVGTSGTWGGIVFNSGSSGAVEYCNIKNATTGITCYYGLPSIRYNTISNNSIGISIYNISTPSNEISNNTIQNNSSKGIYLSYASPKIYSNTITSNGSSGIYCYNSSPYLYGNVITGHSASGLNCTSYSSAYLVPWNAYGYYWGHGENVITNNYGRGIDASYWSNLYLGSSPYGGYNSIYNNTGYELSAQYNCNIMAEINWWGANPPVEAEFNTYQSTIDYTPALSSNPNSAMQGSVTSTEGSASGFNKSVNEDPLLVNAYKLQLEGKFEEAIAAYSNFISTKSDDPNAAYALVRIEECYRLSSKDGFLNYLNKDVRSLAAINNDLVVVSLELESQYFVRAERYNEAIENFSIIKKDYNLNSFIDKFSIFNTGYIYLKFLNDVDNAVKSFEEIAAKYPDDELVAESKYLMGEVNPNFPKNSNLSTAILPSEFGIAQNYPNPFNPTTKISYRLPVDAHVTLKVYDLLGREIATLVNEEKQAGNYEVQFSVKGGSTSGGDAMDLSSGVYLYKITMNDFVKTMKMMVVK